MEDRLKKILSVILEVEEEAINKNASAETIEGWDSLKQMNIIVAMEEEFDIQIDEEEDILSNSYYSLYKLIQNIECVSKPYNFLFFILVFYFGVVFL